MKTFVEWLSGHTLTALLAAGAIWAVGYVFVRRRELFHKK
jgi:hypothetical protein